MAGLLDFAQAASNSAAGNVAGPIDMLAWGLRKMGLPIPNDPVLGTEWMKQKGLIKEVPQSPASLAGETLGLLSPIVAAAKAPQIAGGLLQMGDNLTTAKTLGSGPGGGQKGAIVYHGSPHKFDKFDSSKIGTGEGAQAYGHGLYLAEAPGVATTYSNLRASPNMEFHTASGRKLTGLEKAIADDMLSNGMVSARVGAKANGPEWMDAFNRIKDETITRGNLYKVDLPDEHIARMLDWDKPLSQQAPEVLDALNATKNKQLRAIVDYASSPYSTPGLEGEVKTMGEAIKLLGMNAGNAKGSAMLAKQGIPGIRYLDGGSRGAGQGTSNFVVFPGNEGLLTILERNGVPLR